MEQLPELVVRCAECRVVLARLLQGMPGAARTAPAPPCPHHPTAGLLEELVGLSPAPVGYEWQGLAGWAHLWPTDEVLVGVEAHAVCGMLVRWNADGPAWDSLRDVCPACLEFVEAQLDEPSVDREVGDYITGWMTGTQSAGVGVKAPADVDDGLWRQGFNEGRRAFEQARAGRRAYVKEQHSLARWQRGRRP